jgi:hypothetical protein
MRMLGAIALIGMLAPAVGAQQTSDSMQSMMARVDSMHAMMQQMHQMMASMHGGPGHGGMSGSAMMPMSEEMGECSSSEGFGALLGACPSTLALTEAQTTALRALFERARSEAHAILTPEQQQQLHATPGPVTNPNH